MHSVTTQRNNIYVKNTYLLNNFYINLKKLSILKCKNMKHKIDVHYFILL